MTIRHAVSRYSKRKIRGIYPFVSVLQTVAAAGQNGTTTGALWLRNPVAGTPNTIRGRLRRLEIIPMISAKTEFLTTPRIVAAKFTYTGTPSGGLLLPAQRHSSDLEPVLDIRIASAGMTVALVVLPATVGSSFWGTLIPPFFVASAVGEGFAIAPADPFAPADEDEYEDIAPGEGIVIYQPDAGSGADTRKYLVRGVWDEYDPAATTETFVKLPEDSGNPGKQSLVVSET